MLREIKKTVFCGEVAKESKTRKSIKINLVPDAAKMVETIKEDTGLAQTTFLERLIEWYWKQDRLFQEAIIRKEMESCSRFSRALLREMALASSSNGDVEDWRESGLLPPEPPSPGSGKHRGKP